MKKAFLISRPIQYANVLNIPCENKLAKVLLVVETFSNSQNFIIEQKINKRWEEVHSFPSVYEAVNWLINNKTQFKEFYTFSDNGIRLQYLFFRLRSIDIYIYEEGAATYVKRFYRKVSLLDIPYIIYFRCLSARKSIGTYPLLKGIFVYRPDIYKMTKPFIRTPVLKFKSDFFIHLNNCEDLTEFTYLEGFNFKDKNIVLYLTGWQVNEAAIRLILEKKSQGFFTIIKPHPHLDKSKNLQDIADLVIQNNVFAELIIQKLANESHSVYVIHDNSTSVLNFLQDERIIEINIGETEKSSWYRDVQSLFRNSKNSYL